MARNLVPLIDFAREQRYPSVATFRWWVYNGDENGFSDVVVRIGRRVLIDVDRYWAWVDAQNAAANARRAS